MGIPQVMATCEEELAQREGNAKVALREIVEAAHRWSRGCKPTHDC